MRCTCINKHVPSPVDIDTLTYKGVVKEIRTRRCSICCWLKKTSFNYKCYFKFSIHPYDLLIRVKLYGQFLDFF